MRIIDPLRRLRAFNIASQGRLGVLAIDLVIRVAYIHARWSFPDQLYGVMGKHRTIHKTGAISSAG